MLQVLTNFDRQIIRHIRNAMQVNPETLQYTLNILKPSGHYMYHQFYNSQILLSAHTVYLCILCGSQKKRLFPNTELIGFSNRDGMCLLLSTNWILK